MSSTLAFFGGLVAGASVCISFETVLAQKGDKMFSSVLASISGSLASNFALGAVTSITTYLAVKK